MAASERERFLSDRQAEIDALYRALSGMSTGLAAGEAGNQDREVHSRVRIFRPCRQQDRDTRRCVPRKAI
jgi:hypothetical protein